MKHPEDQPKRHVFVCYSRRDSETVDWVAGELERMGHRIWIDRTGIVGSQTWRAKIVEALRQSSAVIFFGSAESYGSRHVATELTLAEEALKPIIPVLLDDAKPEGDMAYFLARLHRIKFDGGEDHEAIAAIHAALERIEQIKPSENGLGKVARRSRPRRVPVLVPLVASIGLAGLGYSYWGNWFERPVGGGGTQQPPAGNPAAKAAEEKRNDEESAAQARREIAAAQAAEAEKLKEAREREAATKARELQALEEAIAAARAATDAQAQKDAEDARLRKEAEAKAAKAAKAKEPRRSDGTNSPGGAEPSAR